jgi:two-component system cell cycle sensor histidine kinase/response regulator CckA
MQDAQELVRLAPRMAENVRDELSVIQTATDLLINDKSVSAEAREKIATIKAYIGHAADTARAFLIITGTEGSHLTVFDIRDVLSELNSLLQRLLGEGNQLQMVLDRDLWPIKAGEQQFEQIFLVLAFNAREAMPNGGSLRIRATNITKSECEEKPELLPIAADYVLVEVSDTRRVPIMRVERTKISPRRSQNMYSNRPSNPFGLLDKRPSSSAPAL